MERRQSIDSDFYRHHRRAQLCIAGAAITEDRHPAAHVMGVMPTHLKSGHGAYVFDLDGRRYLDFMSPHLLGHSATLVNSAMAAQLVRGTMLPLSTDVELGAAEMVKALFPFVDVVRFFKTAAEARSAALTTALAEGNAQMVRPLDWSASREAIEHLKTLRASGVPLVFDEADSAFRFPKHSAAAWTGITPDVIVIGGLANGMPLYAVGGKFKIMNDRHFDGSAEAAETLSLVACKKTLEILHNRDMATLWKKGQAFLDEFNSVYPEGVRIEGYPTRGRLAGDRYAVALFMQEACRAGMLFGQVWHFTYPLAEEAPNALGAIRAILERIKRNEVELMGEMPKWRTL